MKAVGQGWRAVALAGLLAACDGGGGGGVDPSVASGISATSATAQTAVAGSAVTEAPSVKVVDQRGAAMAGVTVSFAVNGGGAVGSSTAATNASGVASAGTWTLGATAGQQSVTASAGGSLTVQFTATAQARAAAAVTAVSAPTQNGVSGIAVAEAPAVRVNDQTGAPLAGVSVTFAVTSGGGAIATTTATTGANGQASSGTWTLGAAAGPNTVTATVAGLAPVAFNATGAARAATTVTAQSATTQTGAAGAAVAAPPSVRVNDQTGAPMAGVAVTFAVTAGGGVLVGGSATTNASGIATVTSWTLGAAAGTNTVTATVAGLTPVTFTATSTAADPCSTAAGYVLGSTASGSLSTTDCHLSSGEYVDLYSVNLPSAQAVSFTMISTAMDTWLELYDGNGNIAAFNDDGDGTGSNAQMKVFAPAGSYFVAGTSYDANELGAYTLSSASVAGNVNCLEYWVVPGVIINGSVANTDCNFGGFLTDEFLVILRPGQTLTLRLESTVVDAFLQLYDANGNLVQENDDGAGGTNSQIVYTYPASSTSAAYFFIDASTFDPGETGTYALTVTRN
jgi:hypothetical protein